MNPSPLFRQQSTFIPQQAPQHARRGAYNNAFFIIGNVALIAMVLAWGGLFGYRFYLDQNIQKLQVMLKESSAQALDVELIENFKALDTRLTTGNTLLNQHLILEPLFKIIDTSTLTNSVRYNSFKYELDDKNNFAVDASGVATSFTSLAYQEKVLKEISSLSGVTFSDFSLDEKTGNVTFNVKYIVSPELILFKNTEAAGGGSVPLEGETLPAGTPLENPDEAPVI